MLDVLFLLGGLVALYFGSEGVVRGASSIAREMHIRPILIGLTVVSFGTSLPELVVSLFAATDAQPDVAVGMVLGSNVANVALILGVSALIRPVRVDSASAKRDVPFLLGASLLTAALVVFDGTFSRLDGAVMLGFLAFFMALQIRSALKSRRSARELGIIVEVVDRKKSVLFLFLGLVLLAAGGSMLEDAIPGVATSLGVPALVIAGTMVALGTSLPELATSLVATFRDEQDILLGNVVGSNVFNLLLIIGLTAVIVPLDVSDAVIQGQFPWMVAVAAVLFPVTWLGKHVTRLEGGVLVVGYVVFVTMTFRGA